MYHPTIPALISAPCSFPWLHPSSHSEDLTSRKPRNVFNNTFVVTHEESGCSLARVPQHIWSAVVLEAEAPAGEMQDPGEVWEGQRPWARVAENSSAAQLV